MRNEDGLPVLALIEYGAQAMAVHGGLLAKSMGNKINEGYLAALRDVSFSSGDVSGIHAPLYIEATKLMASQGNMIYNFSVKADDMLLISGRATVVAIFNN
ncbi:MAG: hypothetical protein RQ783_08265 [Gammaproteobacteria bacterium]|nr:hypothetical protein [Gammaproteobacteria bacterium]